LARKGATCSRWQPKKGKKLWSYATGGVFLTRVADRVVYVVSDDEKLYAFGAPVATNRMISITPGGQACLHAKFEAMRPEIEQAVALLQGGDEAGVGQAIALLQNAVFSFSMKVCGHRQDAEDTMQEVLTKSIPATKASYRNLSFQLDTVRKFLHNRVIWAHLGAIVQ